MLSFLEINSINGILEFLLKSLADVSIKTALLLAIGMLVVFIARKSSASFRHQVLTIIFTSLLVMPLLCSLLPSWNLVSLTELILSDANKAIVGNEIISFVETTSLVSYATIADKYSELMIILLQVWFLGVMVVAVRFLFGIVYIRRIINTSKPSSENNLLSILVQCQSKLQLKRKVNLLTNAKSIIPFSSGLFTAKIILPDEALSWKDQKLSNVLIHELAHIKRNDNIVIAITNLVCSMYWFNPLVWFARNKLQHERELACDEFVLGSGIKASEYAKQLLDIVREQIGGSRQFVCETSITRKSKLEKRIKSILNFQKKRNNMKTSKMLFLYVTLSLIIVSLASLSTIADDQLPKVDEFVKVERTPEFLHKEAPKYPEIARKAGIEGKVMVKVLVDKNGDVADAVIFKESGVDVGFEESALEAAKKCKFKPATLNDEPMAVWITYHVAFNLDSDKENSTNAKKIDSSLEVEGVIGVKEDNSSYMISKVPRKDDVSAIVDYKSEPQMIHMEKPIYPEEDRKAGREGTVSVKVLIDKEGKIQDVSIAKTSGSNSLDKAALNSVKKSTFKPAIENGKAVATWITYQIMFELDDEK